MRYIKLFESFTDPWAKLRQFKYREAEFKDWVSQDEDVKDALDWSEIYYHAIRLTADWLGVRASAETERLHKLGLISDSQYILQLPQNQAICVYNSDFLSPHSDRDISNLVPNLLTLADDQFDQEGVWLSPDWELSPLCKFIDSKDFSDPGDPYGEFNASLFEFEGSRFVIWHTYDAVRLWVKLY